MPIKVHTKALWARTKAKELHDAKAMEAAAAKAAVKLAREQAKKDIKQSQAAKRGRPPAKTNQPPAAKQESGRIRRRILADDRKHQKEQEEHKGIDLLFVICEYVSIFDL